MSKIHPRNPLLRLRIAGGDFGGLLGELGALLGGHHGHLRFQHVVLQRCGEISRVFLGALGRLLDRIGSHLSLRARHGHGSLGLLVSQLRGRLGLIVQVARGRLSLTGRLADRGLGLLAHALGGGLSLFLGANSFMDYQVGRVMEIIDREFPGVHRENLVVLDGTTGQNALVQAREFAQVMDLTGIILTKMDGTAKGGIAVAIQSELHVPVKYIGVGEKIEDLQKFDPDQFVNALFDTEKDEVY